MMLEATVLWRRQKMLRDPFQKLALDDLEPGDRITAIWELGEGMHYIVRGISKIEPEGQALAIALMQTEVRENYSRIRDMQDTVNNLRNQLNRLIKQFDGEE